MTDPEQSVRERRSFLRSVGAGGVALSSASAASAAASTKRAADTAWHMDADVLIVGSGAAACAAAVSASNAGAKVVMIEKAPVAGGTTAKSDGGIWIPNNRFMREKGIEDRKDDVLRLMAKLAYPGDYRPDAVRFGLGENEYALIEAYYDEAPRAIEFLEKAGAVSFAAPFPLVDYADALSENKATRGRLLFALAPSGGVGRGSELIRQFRAFLTKKGVPLLLNHRAGDVLRDESGRVVGASVHTRDGKLLNFRARRGVVFASGGYTHNAELVRHYQPGPVVGGCAIPTAEGDFIPIAQSVGAKLGNMSAAWRMEIILDQAMEGRSVPRGLWQPPGDSMILVNKYGKRVVGEKRNYHERTRVHYEWDANKSEYRNLLLFMVYDRRSAELFAGNFPIPQPGSKAAYVLQSETLEGLAAVIQKRLDQFREKFGPYGLDADFAVNLAETISKFNGYARTGFDAEFDRGARPYDAEWHTAYMSVPRQDTGWKPAAPNPVMHPFFPEGPYFAVILAPGVLDTNGGPVINRDSQVLDARGSPIAGLYGAGNCVASPAGQSYVGGGATLGMALTFGHIAGRQVAVGQ